MSYHITVIERMILESLAQQDKNIDELSACTKLDKAILNLVIQPLTAKGLVQVVDNKFHLNKSLTKSMKKELHSDTNVQGEINQITSTCFKTRNTKSIYKLKKVFMNKSEEQIFNAMLKNLELFIEGVSNKTDAIAEKKIIFWGETNYETLTNHSLSC